MSVREELEQEVRRVATESGWSEEAAQILAWIGTEAMTLSVPIDDSQLQTQLARLGKAIRESTGETS